MGAIEFGLRNSFNKIFCPAVLAYACFNNFVGVFVICLLVFTVFLYCLFYGYLFLFATSVRTTDNNINNNNNNNNFVLTTNKNLRSGLLTSLSVEN